MAAKIFSAKKRAASLVEVAISLLLIAIALLGIMAAFTMSVSSLTAVRDKEAATRVALGLMNELEGVELNLLEDYVENLLDSPDHYPGYTITNDDVYEILTLHPNKTAPISAEITIAIRRTGRDSGVVLTREVSGIGHFNAGYKIVNVD